MLEDDLVSVPVPDTYTNYDIHVSFPTCNELQFGCRPFCIDHRKLFAMSTFDRSVYKYTAYIKFHDRKLLGYNLLKNTKYVYMPDLFNNYLQSVGEGVKSDPPMNVLLFEEVKMNLTYCLPSVTREFELTDIKKKFKIESQLSMINKEDGNLKKGDPRRSRFILYKKKKKGITKSKVQLESY
jgi:hypothetical protein